jgi:hypothetical protein
MSVGTEDNHEKLVEDSRCSGRDPDRLHPKYKLQHFSKFACSGFYLDINSNPYISTNTRNTCLLSIFNITEGLKYP